MSACGVTPELVEELREAEEALYNLPANIPNKEFVERFAELEEKLLAVSKKACEAIYQSTKNINSRETIFQVYGGLNKSTGLPRLNHRVLSQFLPKEKQNG